MHNTSQSQDMTDLGPFSPGDEERFRSNALVALVAFGSLTLLGGFGFLVFF
ncbi:hypothetical protein [Nocardiopsis valliformis]|uniref:hypothetical protein n=1 Tax=Nocardiopsis valliformis TaxID=239974 RepID=UPI00034B8819|nr:hypothetical protein [Nocardiopsis valliformis]